MARSKFKWKFIVCFHLLVLSTIIRSLPIVNTKLPNLVTVDTNFPKLEVPVITKVDDGLDLNDKKDNPLADVIFYDANKNDTRTNEGNQTQQFISEDSNTGLVHSRNVSRSLLRNIRPGQDVRQYAVSLTFDGDSFNGRTVIDVRVTPATIEDPLAFFVEELDIQSVMIGVFTDANAVNVDFWVEDGILNIGPELQATSYIAIVEYSGQMSSLRGLYQGSFQDASYIAMNLHPTNARRVFPCMDELTAAATITFTFNEVPFPNIHANTMLEEESTNQFRPLQGTAHLWGMVAHNFPDVIIPLSTVHLHGRLGARFQDHLASVAINNYFNALEEWTNKPYFGIVVNQDERLNVIALPDASMDWYALSTVCIWEPDILMPAVHSVKQRKNVIVKVAEALARQWFGYVIYPENWESEWVISGLASYSAYEIARNFQTNALGEDLSLVDMDAIFVTDVIRESMYYDSYSNAPPLQPEDGALFDEATIRQHINSPIQRNKASAILRMLRLILGREEDNYIQLAAQSLLSSRALQTVTNTDFYDAITSHWFYSENKLIDNIADFLFPWVHNRGYPLIYVGLRQGGVYITQEYFAFAQTDPVNFMIPLTFTTSINPNFELENVYNIQMMDLTTSINMVLDEEQRDYVLFNIQGQGYYRVNYDDELWDRIIEALENPETRQQIHPLNRATLVDDALNLARAGKLDYDVAFRVVLTMEHETEYAVWKAFVRNMDFIRKHLVAWVEEDDDEELDPDIYLRMVRRTVTGVEQQLGFYPDPQINEPAMASLTRGLVMSHACRANYAPCIAAAVDWFYMPGADEPTVNPDIPPDIRPAVYCTMVSEGDDQVVAALYNRLEIEESMYERLVILESLACSRDEGFIGTLLQETIDSSRYGVEERVRIFKAVAESSFQNARIAMNFMSMRTMDIRNSYGGPEKLEEVLYTLADNIVGGLPFDFQIWVNSINSNLDDSTDLAEMLRDRVGEDELWNNLFRQYVYEWIDENDAPTLGASVFLLTLTLLVTLFNN